MIRITCPYCGDTTDWPDENEVYAVVYAAKHVIENCPSAPVDMRAEAVVILEDMVQEGMD